MTRHDFNLETQPTVVLTLFEELINVCTRDPKAWARVNKQLPLTYTDTTPTESSLHWWELREERGPVRSFQQIRRIPEWLWELVHTEGLPDPIAAIRADPNYPHNEHTLPDHDDEPPTTIRKRR